MQMKWKVIWSQSLVQLASSSGEDLEWSLGNVWAKSKALDTRTENLLYHKSQLYW